MKHTPKLYLGIITSSHDHRYLAVLDKYSDGYQVLNTVGYPSIVGKRITSRSVYTKSRITDTTESAITKKVTNMIAHATIQRIDEAVAITMYEIKEWL